MNKLFIIFVFASLPFSLRAMNYGVVNIVDQGDLVTGTTKEEIESGVPSKRSLFFKGIVVNESNELFEAVVVREYSPAMINPILNNGKFKGNLLRIFQDQYVGPVEELQLHEASLLFTKFANSIADIKIAKYASMEAERKVLLQKIEKEKEQRSAELNYAKLLN